MVVISTNLYPSPKRYLQPTLIYKNYIRLMSDIIFVYQSTVGMNGTRMGNNGQHLSSYNIIGIMYTENLWTLHSLICKHILSSCITCTGTRPVSLSPLIIRKVVHYHIQHVPQYLSEFGTWQFLWIWNWEWRMTIICLHSEIIAEGLVI